MLTIFYLKSTTLIDYKDWDVDTVTAGDYTVMMEITSRMFEQYKIEHLKNKQEIPSFLKHLKNRIEEEVSKCENVLPKRKDDKIEVACISFGYKNRSIILPLLKRGALIGNAKFDKLEPIDK